MNETMKVDPATYTTPGKEVTTEYVVLIENGGRWHKQGNVSARSGEAAIRTFIGEGGNDDTDPAGTYVAIPARSWKPVTVRAVPTVTLKLEDAS